MSVRILTDSTCDLPQEVISQLGISVIPLYIHFDNQDYLDGIDLSREDFFSQLSSFQISPTTAVPSDAKFHAMYDSLADEGASEVLSIHISGKLSAVVNVAQAAAKETTSVPVTVLDSRTLSMGTGFLVQEAARLARAGANVRDILDKLERLIKRIHVWAALDTLEFLKRSGRMNTVMAGLGELLQLKPLLKMYDGVYGVERVRTRKNAIARLQQKLEEYGPFEQMVFIHTNAIDRAKALQNEAMHLLNEKTNTWISTLNPVLGAHLGPGVVGFAAISAE
ncbi:MAG: DegV family protein [Anaerolineaceae bacterium]